MAASAQNETPGLFDRFAGAVSAQVAKAPFFALCLALVLIWLPSYLVIRDFEQWSLWINNPSTILTLLCVALLQNSAARADKAAQLKANAIADGLADLTEALGQELGSERLHAHARDLRAAVGLEDRVHS